MRGPVFATLVALLATSLVAAGCESNEPTGPQPPQPILPPPGFVPGGPPIAPPGGPPGARPPPPAADASPKEPVTLRRVDAVPATFQLDAAHHGFAIGPSNAARASLKAKSSYRTQPLGAYELGTSSGTSHARDYAALVKETRPVPSKEVWVAGADANDRLRSVGALPGAAPLSGTATAWFFLLNEQRRFVRTHEPILVQNVSSKDARNSTMVQLDAADNNLLVESWQRVDVVGLDPSVTYRLAVHVHGGPPGVFAVATLPERGGSLRVTGGASRIRQQLFFPSGDYTLQGLTSFWLSLPLVAKTDPGTADVQLRALGGGGAKASGEAPAPKGSSNALFEQGRRAAGRGRWAEAARAFDQCLKVDPNRTDCATQLATARQKLGQNQL